MLFIPPNAKVFLAVSPVDFRRQIPGLKKWVQHELMQNPLSGAYFFFFSRNRKAIKVLHFDGQGTCLYWKKLSAGKFKKWSGIYDSACKYAELVSTEGQVILMNGDSRHLKIPKNWRELP